MICVSDHESALARAAAEKGCQVYSLLQTSVDLIHAHTLNQRQANACMKQSSAQLEQSRQVLCETYLERGE